MILMQLILGATMRHQHAGLAIPDFPLAYGKLWPAMDADSVAYYNQIRTETTAVSPITAFQVGLQMVHRITALLISVAIIWAARMTQRRLGWGASLTKLSFAWLGLILSQVALGAATIWTNKSADIATAHVAVGALSLLTGAMLILVAYRCLERKPESEAVASVTPNEARVGGLKFPA
jgi:cytochrome c oxidase assembly protein subunit 15